MKKVFSLIMGTLFLLLGASAWSQAYPSKPIRLIVPFAAGGGADLTMRLMATELGTGLGQSLIVENRPGVAGVVGLDALGQSAPDGYTLMFFSNTTSVALRSQKRDFEPRKLFTPIGNAVLATAILLVNPAVVNVKNVGEFNAFLRANPGTHYTSNGPGSPGNLLIAVLGVQNGFKVEHVAYKGAAPAMADAAAGRVGIVIGDALSARPHIQSGALRPIAAVASVRTPLLPDLLTSGEQGFPQFAYDSYNGLVVTAGTPAAIVERLRVATRRAVESPTFAEFVTKAGSRPVYIDGPQWEELLLSDFQRWGEAIRVTGISPP